MEYLEKVGIREIWGALLVADLQGMKEEAAKYLVSRYHSEKLWLDQTHSFSDMTIQLITGLPYKGTRYQRRLM